MENIVTRAQLVKAVRKEMKLNQVDFAEKMGVDQSSVSYWETDTYELTNDRLFKMKRLFEKETGKLDFSRKVFGPFIEKILEG